MNAPAKGLRQIPITLAGLQDEQGHPFQFPLLVMDDGRAFFPIRPLCRILSIDAQAQLERLRQHAVLSQLMVLLRVETARGRQETWCIERRGIGFWWGGIQLSKVRRGLQPRILELQWQIVDLANRALFGEVDADPVRAQLVTHDTQIEAVTRFTLALEQRIGRIEERIESDTGEDGTH